MSRYAVIGNPVEHSLSPEIHTAFARQLGQQITYEKRYCERDGFADSASEFFSEGGSGLNVTVPFKSDAFDWVDRVSGDARLAGAVNTIVPADGLYTGHNTDGVGLISDLKRLGIDVEGANILILGAGGAVAGVLPALLRQAPAEIVIANRTESKARALCRSMEDSRLRSTKLEQIDGDFDVVVNATSMGLHGQTVPLDEDLARRAVCYDMTYGPSALFFGWAKSIGARSHDGLGMLVGQAAEAFYLWRGVRPDPEPVVEQMQTVVSA